MARFVTEAGAAHRLAFRPRPDDVFISTYAKCGTTWMQQIVHGLRTGGAMDFDEISAVVPWLELAHDTGLDLNAPQAALPRAFKTHLAADELPAGGRAIVVLRDPKDVLLSLYRFLEGWFFETGSISLDSFARDSFMVGSGSHHYWHHVAVWWPRRHDSDVLMFCFEEMKQDLAGVVARVADFIGVPADTATLEIATRQASFAFMREHVTQFDDHFLREARDEACGLPPGGDSAKVRSGRVGDHAKALPADLGAALDAIWRDEIAGPLGLASYAALRRQLSAERARAST